MGFTFWFTRCGLSAFFGFSALFYVAHCGLANDSFAHFDIFPKPSGAGSGPSGRSSQSVSRDALGSSPSADRYAALAHLENCSSGITEPGKRLLPSRFIDQVHQNPLTRETRCRAGRPYESSPSAGLPESRGAV